MFKRLLKRFTDKELYKPIYSLLDNLLLSASRYTTFPIYIIQFMIHRISYEPSIALVTYTNKVMIDAMSKINYRLDQVLINSLPESINPTVIIYPSSFSLPGIIYSANDTHYYSSAYLVDIERFRKGLKNKSLEAIELYSYSSESDYVSSAMVSNADMGYVELPKIKTFFAKLPFINISKINYHLKGIIKEIIDERYIYIDDPEKVENIFETVKNNQTMTYNGIQIFKDFMKQKPLTLRIYSHDEKEEENIIKSVCLQMDFNNKLTHLVFYRYISGILTSIVGSIKEFGIDEHIPIS